MSGSISLSLTTTARLKRSPWNALHAAAAEALELDLHTTIECATSWPPCVTRRARSWLEMSSLRLGMLSWSAHKPGMPPSHHQRPSFCPHTRLPCPRLIISVPLSRAAQPCAQITEQLENILPAGDELLVTVVRPEDGQLPKLLANMTPRPHGQLLNANTKSARASPKVSRPSLSMGQIINNGVQLPVDQMLSSPLAKMEFSDRKEEEQSPVRLLHTLITRGASEGSAIVTFLPPRSKRACHHRYSCESGQPTCSLIGPGEAPHTPTLTVYDHPCAGPRYRRARTALPARARRAIRVQWRGELRGTHPCPCPCPLLRSATALAPLSRCVCHEFRRARACSRAGRTDAPGAKACGPRVSARRARVGAVLSCAKAAGPTVDAAPGELCFQTHFSASQLQHRSPHRLGTR